jgi:hypothetical protein
LSGGVILLELNKITSPPPFFGSPWYAILASGLCSIDAFLALLIVFVLLGFMENRSFGWSKVERAIKYLQEKKYNIKELELIDTMAENDRGSAQAANTPVTVFWALPLVFVATIGQLDIVVAALFAMGILAVVLLSLTIAMRDLDNIVIRQAIAVYLSQEPNPNLNPSVSDSGDLATTS